MSNRFSIDEHVHISTRGGHMLTTSRSVLQFAVRNNIPHFGSQKNFIFVDMPLAYVELIVEYFSSHDGADLVDRALQDGVFFGLLHTFNMVDFISKRLDRNTACHGALFYLGTDRRSKKPWRNPHDARLVQVHCNCWDAGGANMRHWADHFNSPFLTQLNSFNPLSHVQIDLLEDGLNPTGYALRSRLRDNDQSRTWRLLASKDGKVWVAQRERRAERTLQDNEHVMYYSIPRSNEIYRHFRLEQHREDPRQQCMHLAGIELFGRIVQL